MDYMENGVPVMDPFFYTFDSLAVSSSLQNFIDHCQKFGAEISEDVCFGLQPPISFSFPLFFVRVNLLAHSEDFLTACGFRVVVSHSAACSPRS
jgi:hypothetical protein